MAAGTQVASLFAKISADASQFEREAGKVKKELNTLQRGFQDWGNVAAGMGKAAAVGIAAAGAALVGIGAVVAKTGVQFNAMKEQAQISFETMLGSGERAKAFLDDLQKFAASTPFEFPDLVRASQRLLAMGIAAQDVKPMLTAVGDAVAALGGSSELVNRVTTALGQMSAKGKVSAEEMLQLTEAGIPAWDILADKIGVSIPEAMKMATKGSIDAGTAIDALVEGMNDRFGGLMAKQSQTWNGLISTIKDNFAILSGQITAPFFEMMRGGLKKVADATSYLSTNWGKLKLAWEDGAGALKDLLMIFGLNEESAQRIGQIYVDIRTKFQEVIAVIQKVILALQPFVSSLIDLINKSGVWKDALVALGIILGSTLLVAIGGFIAAMWPMLSLLAAVTTAVTVLRWSWTNDFLNIRSVTEQTFAKISGWFKEHIGPIQNLWAGTYTFILGDTKIKVPLIVGMFLGQLNYWKVQAEITVKGFIANWKHQLSVWKSEVKYVIDTFVADSKSKFEHWVSVTKEKVTFWVDHWKYKLGQWASHTKYLLDEFLADVKEFRDKYFGWFRPEDWAQMARNWIQGLWNGVTEKWNAFTGWWRDRWQDLKDGWNRFWQSHSPSMWFEASGRNLMEGLRIGIDGGALAVFASLSSINDEIVAGMTQAIAAVHKGAAYISTGLQNIPKASGIDPMRPNNQATGGALNSVTPIAPRIDKFIDQAAGIFGYAARSWLPDVLGDFSSDLMSLFTGPGQNEFIGVPVRNALATLSDPNVENTSTSGLIAAIQLLVAEIRTRGLGSNFNLAVAPAMTGDTAADIRATVEYLQALYA